MTSKSNLLSLKRASKPDIQAPPLSPKITNQFSVVIKKNPQNPKTNGLLSKISSDLKNAIKARSPPQNP
jgi:hypothetical protein